VLTIRSVSQSVNTPGIATLCIAQIMAMTKAERLREARKKAGYSSAAEAAQRFSWNEPAYRHHENGTRNFGLDAARKYGRAFRVKPGWLLGLENVDSGPPEEKPDEERLVVNGSVAAGVWRESDHWNDERQFGIDGSQSPVPHAKRFGVVVEGRSMDLAYEPGTVLDCVSIFGDHAVIPQTGDHVIVERVRPDGLRELTVKEYLEEDGRYFLLPRSSRPEFQQRIEIGEPDHDYDGDDRVQVIAFVVGSYPPRALGLLRRMGLIVPEPSH
jgi:SOS-response transcriptional repressor LexA